MLNMSFNIKKSLGIFCYYIAPLALAGLSFFNVDDDLFPLLGNLSLMLLGITLFVKPLAAIFKINFLWTIVSWRRELGLLVFWLFFFHAAGLIYMFNLYKPEMWADFPIGLYFGLVAGLGLLLIAPTSNNYAIRLLKRNWKRLHYSVYVIFLFALLHRALIKGEYIFPLSIFFIFVILKVIEFRKLKKQSTVQ